MISGIVSNVTTNVGDLAFFTYSDGSTASESMRINSSGNVGIGTNAPDTLLHINGGGLKIKQAVQLDATSGAFYEGLTFENVATTHAYSIGYNAGGKFGLNYFNGTSTYSSFLLVNSGGDVGIGSTPSYKLDVAGDINFTGTIYNNGVEFSGGSEWNRNGNKIYYNTDNVGIGTNNPSNAKLEINGTNGSVSFGVNSYAELSSNGVKLGAATTASYSIYASGAIAGSEFNAISDARVKNVKEIRDNKKDIETLEQMNVYEFNYIDKLNYGTKDKIGFIAQDLEKLNNNLVNYSKNFIPNIFKNFKINNNKVILDKDYDLKINDILKLEITVYSRKLLVEKKILEINNNEILIELPEMIENNEIFIYGKKVDDFRTINFEQIIGMNVSSIKYLYNEIKEIKDNQEKLYNLIKNKLNI